jgi:hypothetical protein
VSSLSHPLSLISLVTTRPSDARHTTPLFATAESQCAVQSSARRLGLAARWQHGLRRGASFHENDGPLHSHSGVVRLAHHVRGHRQDCVRSVVRLLHQVLVCCRGAPCSKHCGHRVIDRSSARVWSCVSSEQLALLGGRTATAASAAGALLAEHNETRLQPHSCFPAQSFACKPIHPYAA